LLPRKLGAQAVVAVLSIKLVVAKVEVVGVIVVAAAIEVLLVKQVEETNREAVAPHKAF